MQLKLKKCDQKNMIQGMFDIYPTNTSIFTREKKIRKNTQFIEDDNVYSFEHGNT